jgi:dipeptidyl aminopeptidase/acylaminoacyl peptidase
VLEIWTIDGVRRTRVTFGPESSGDVVWSPDGTRLAYQARFGAELRELVPGTNTTRTLATFTGASDNVYPTDWSRDGRFIAYVSWSNGTEDLHLFPTGGGPSISLATSPFNEGAARFSPDGRFIAYRSNESGRPEVYVQALPPATGRWLVSTSGGSQPMWRGDGRELYYLDPDNLLMAVPISLGAAVTAGTPVPLFRLRIQESTSVAVRNHYAVTSDGQRFLVKSVPTGARLKAILHWNAGLSSGR